MDKRCFYVKSDIKKYISGERNAVKDEFVISREKLNGNEYVHVGHSELPEPLYTFWHAREKTSTPKHTGGKKPYVMVMVKELVYLMKEGLSPDYAGYLLYLIPYIEWGTGRLLYGRNKRQMKFNDIKATFGRSYKTTQKIIAGLREYNLLTYGREGYFISRGLIKKGGVKNENKVQEGDHAGANS